MKESFQALRFAQSVLMLAAALVLAGCVVGQELDFEYEASAMHAVGDGSAVTLNVTDDRPYVTSGDKPPYYIGQYRAGFGIPYDVSTDGDQPLAEVIDRDLRKELLSLGFEPTTGEAALTTLAVSIQDWDFDTYQNGTFDYDIQVQVLRGEEVIASQQAKDSVYVKGSAWSGGKGGFEKAMPDMYRGAIQSIIQNNAEILDALTSH